MDFKKYVTYFLEKVKFYWKRLTFKHKAIMATMAVVIIALCTTGIFVKSYVDEQNLSPQMKLFKKDGTMFMLVSKRVSENKDNVAYIKGNTAPHSDVKVGYGIFGDTTTADSNGKFILRYEDHIQENTNIKITARVSGKSITRIVTILPSPQIQKKIENKNQQIKKYKYEAKKIKKLDLKGVSYIDAKREILKISANTDVKSQSNTSEIKEVDDSEKVTDIIVNQDKNGISVILSLDPSDADKKALADEKEQLSKEKEAAASKEKYIKNVEAYEVRFKDYALEYLIDKNTSTIYQMSTADTYVAQSKFTGNMDSKIEFNLDGLRMIAYHHYVGQPAAAYFNDETGNSNKAWQKDPETFKKQYFPKVNLPF